MAVWPYSLRRPWPQRRDEPRFGIEVRAKATILRPVFSGTQTKPKCCSASEPERSGRCAFCSVILVYRGRELYQTSDSELPGDKIQVDRAGDSSADSDGTRGRAAWMRSRVFEEVMARQRTGRVCVHAQTFCENACGRCRLEVCERPARLRSGLPMAVRAPPIIEIGNQAAFETTHGVYSVPGRAIYFQWAITAIIRADSRPGHATSGGMGWFCHRLKNLDSRGCAGSACMSVRSGRSCCFSDGRTWRDRFI